MVSPPEPPPPWPPAVVVVVVEVPAPAFPPLPVVVPVAVVAEVVGAPAVPLLVVAPALGLVEPVLPPHANDAARSIDQPVLFELIIIPSLQGDRPPRRAMGWRRIIYELKIVGTRARNAGRVCHEPAAQIALPTRQVIFGGLDPETWRLLRVWHERCCAGDPMGFASALLFLVPVPSLAFADAHAAAPRSTSAFSFTQEPRAECMSEDTIVRRVGERLRGDVTRMLERAHLRLEGHFERLQNPTRRIAHIVVSGAGGEVIGEPSR